MSRERNSKGNQRPSADAKNKNLLLLFCGDPLFSSFLFLSARLFDEEMTNIKDQLRALRAGTHKDYERNAKKLKYQLDSALIRSEQLNAMESERIEAEHLELMDTIEAEHAVTVAQLKQVGPKPKQKKGKKRKKKEKKGKNLP